MANKQNPNDPNVEKGRYLTTGEKIRNFTGWAFAITLVLELIAVPFYHHYGHPAQEQTEKPITISKETIKPPPTPPPPTPTPPPTPQPRQTPQPHVVSPPRPMKISPPKLHSNSGAGPVTQRYVPPKNACSGANCLGPATSTAPPAPPAPTPASCPDPSQEAHTLQVAQPNYPESAQELGLGEVTVEVVVTLGPSGNVLSASIGSDPAHNSAIEMEALRVARMTTYAPKLENCKPVTSQYQYLVTFTPD
jgi:protein TonB